MTVKNDGSCSPPAGDGRPERRSADAALGVAGLGLVGEVAGLGRLRLPVRRDRARGPLVAAFRPVLPRRRAAPLAAVTAAPGLRSVAGPGFAFATDRPVADGAELASGVGRPARRACPGPARARARRRPPRRHALPPG